jgi:hypothetical protein
VALAAVVATSALMQPWPLPPRPPAGAPARNASFVNNEDGSLYYSYVAKRANFSDARAACARMNGSLAMWRSADSQYAVERYLHRSGALAKYYWLGIARPRQGAPFAFVDGSSVPNIVSNGKPYAHWAWTQPTYAQAVAYSCALAWQDLAFDQYKSADRNTSSLVSMANYNTDPRYAAFKYGWTAYDCSVAYPFICQIPAANFPCMPPPSPPAPPPSPPVPPSPPAPPSCEPPCVGACKVTAAIVGAWCKLTQGASDPAQPLTQPMSGCPGAPAANTTLFCDPATDTCYVYNTAQATFNSARAACQALGGDLARWDSPDKQLAAEVGGCGAQQPWRAQLGRISAQLTPGRLRCPPAPQTYFLTMGTLTPLYYWIGIRRANTSSPFAYLDGSALPQLPSNSPYAHWNWYQPLAANHSLYNCAMAYNAYRSVGRRALGAAGSRWTLPILQLRPPRSTQCSDHYTDMRY